MRRFLTAIAAGTLMSGAALAADLPTKAPPIAPSPMATYDWTGLYIGLHGGYAEDRTRWTFGTVSFYNLVAGENFGTKPKGTEAGGHIGYNFWQGGNLVLGVEASYDPTETRQTLVGPLDPAFPNDAFRTKLGDLFTATGRLGLASNNWLFYVKGGFASAELKLHVLSGAPVPGVILDANKRLNGGTVGVGVEYALWSNVIAGIEYDYVQLQAHTFPTITTTGAVTTAVAGLHNSHVDESMVLGRLSFKFGGGMH
jgi:outer membrane immunogenic protein